MPHQICSTLSTRFNSLLETKQSLRRVVLKGREANEGGWVARFPFRLAIFLYFFSEKRSFVSTPITVSEHLIGVKEEPDVCMSSYPCNSLSVTLVFHLDALQPPGLILNYSFTGYPSFDKLSAVTNTGEQEHM